MGYYLLIPSSTKLSREKWVFLFFIFITVSGAKVVKDVSLILITSTASLYHLPSSIPTDICHRSQLQKTTSNVSCNNTSLLQSVRTLQEMVDFHQEHATECLPESTFCLHVNQLVMVLTHSQNTHPKATLETHLTRTPDAEFDQKLNVVSQQSPVFY